jgi:hypothetical protein
MPSNVFAMNERARGQAELRVLPSDDVAFGRQVEELWAALAAELGSPSPDHLQERLRTRYPKVVVRPRSPLAGMDHARVLYVLREDPLTPRRGDTSL